MGDAADDAYELAIMAEYRAEMDGELCELDWEPDLWALLKDDKRRSQERAAKKTELQKIADRIIERLKREGFTIQRYDAYSTNSIYLKLDYGVCNSIRIGDHAGKKHLRYRYNIMTQYKKYRYENTNVGPRYFYPARKLDKMIEQILQDRAQKQRQYGEMNYRIFKQRNFAEHQNDKGFWSQAVMV